MANDDVGDILVDSQGRTLYLFQRDSGRTSACSGACAVDWPPLRVTAKPSAGKGTKASIVATSARSDGKAQVTYNGHPLYLFSGDQKPGDTNGQGVNAFGGLWYAVSPTGDQVTTQPPRVAAPAIRTSAIRTAGVDAHGRADTVPARTGEQHQEG